MILTSKKEQVRFLKFAVVGLIGAVVDFGLLNLLMVASVSYTIASMISFICAALNNFLWNRYWTYPDSRSKPIAQQLIQFGVINVIGLAIRTPLLAGLENILIQFFSSWVPADFFLAPDFIAHNVGLTIAILIVMLWNFLANRFWTYNDVSS